MIQCYVEEDDPKTSEELDGLSHDELEDWLNIRVAYLQVLIDDVKCNKNRGLIDSFI